MKEASALLIVVLTALSMFSMLAPARAQGVSVFFYDDFEGVAVDPAKWNTDVATSGVRWNSSTADPTLAHTSPGSWEVPPVSPPYGSITVNNSIISFSDTDTPLRAFPYIWAGPPSRPSPFPEKGDFTFEVRMKYDRVSPHGTGLLIVGWPNSTPVGDNPPRPAEQFVAGVWGGVGWSWPETVDDLNWHTYKLTYVDGEYSFFADDYLVMGPNASTLLPNTIWIGNPSFTWWSTDEWSRFRIDFVRVTLTDDTPPTIGSPSREPSDDVSPGQEVTVHVNTTDAETGVKNVTLSYTTDNGTSWNDLPMTYNSTTSLYQATIPGKPNCTWVKYKIIAYDNAENHAIKDNDEEYYVYHVIPEYPPLITLPLFVIATLLVIVYRRKHSM